ncbi:30S ribosomal protein S15 [archaeon]|jgi:small subunit ribosomal protein S15|nr:30S ribosomal protein S15 [archaeon]MBT4647791.1 30S ribosomal protein S15 [archaeon]MBT6821652.1 30S ribosomal protein S15 [archaeon]MBT7391820.1 30S ribosomal protein S15 [archaeon]
MARMYSRKKGKSGSTKPVGTKTHTWIRYKPKEIELLIIKLAKEEYAPSEIGLILRDKYGIPDVKALTKKSISDILAIKDLLPKVPENLTNLIRKAIDLRKHLETNNSDIIGKRGLILTESKIRRLAKYCIRTNKLPADWKYDPKKASLLIE